MPSLRLPLVHYDQSPTEQRDKLPALSRTGRSRRRHNSAATSSPTPNMVQAQLVLV